MRWDDYGTPTSIEIKTVLCTAMILLIGCGYRDADQLMPDSGFNYAKVSYDPKPIIDPTVISVPLIHLENYPNQIVDLELPSTIPPGAGLAFEGQLTVAKPKHRGGIIYVEFFQTDPEGDDRCTAAALLPLEVVGDILKYRLEIHAPKSKGKHGVMLRILHPPSTEGLFKIAIGNVDIRN